MERVALPIWSEATSEKRGDNSQRRQSKSKGKGAVTCYQCGIKGHKKPDCRYYKAALERKKSGSDKKKEISDKKKETKSKTQNGSKSKEKVNVTSSNVVIEEIEELSDLGDILCTTLSTDEAYV